MTEEKIIKSDERVKAHGEVFTPKNIVNQMLNTFAIQPELQKLSATFLEPAAGEGAFLTEILLRKLKIASRVSHTIEAFEQNSLIALTSLYGIELLVDNTELLVIHMYQVFYQEYLRQLSIYNAPENKKVVKSALTIVKANMVQGNALTGKNKNGNDIVFSEWSLLPVKRGIQKVQRTEYTLDAIKNGESSVEGQQQIHGIEEISLFNADEDICDRSEKIASNAAMYRYAPTLLTNVYQELKTIQSK